MKRNSVHQVVQHLRKNPFSTERKIMQDVWGYTRGRSLGSNKKYAELIRRGLAKGLYSRINAQVQGEKSKFFYYLSNYKLCQNQ